MLRLLYKINSNVWVSACLKKNLKNFLQTFDFWQIKHRVVDVSLCITVGGWILQIWSRSRQTITRISGSDWRHRVGYGPKARLWQQRRARKSAGGKPMKSPSITAIQHLLQSACLSTASTELESCSSQVWWLCNTAWCAESCTTRLDLRFRGMLSRTGEFLI